jgi:hypothetical protein
MRSAMKNKGIIIFLIFLAVIIVAIIVAEFISNRPDKRPANPFEYNIEAFKDVNAGLVTYRETKNFNIGFDQPGSIDVKNNKIYVAGDRSVKIVDFSGVLINEIGLPGTPRALEVTGDSVFVALENRILIFSEKGGKLAEWELPEENTYITSLAVLGKNVFVADAGKRRIVRFTTSGEKINEFEGKAENEALHGFIIPSPYFDIGINSFGELWAVNPGMHSFENYTFDGNLRAYWNKTGINIDGFSGCCNPAHFAFLNNGSFVTSEKGLVRIKIHKPSGELQGVVASPVKFDNQDEAPDVAADTLGNIYALDFDKKMVRVFEPI